MSQKLPLNYPLKTMRRRSYRYKTSKKQHLVCTTMQPLFRKLSYEVSAHIYKISNNSVRISSIEEICVGLYTSGANVSAGRVAAAS